ncbi:hypothetical protein BC826DRAFT_1083840 [Russula brevipes]|nr:hypothetical protein BC826DRAFT_1083840 [Russula brevipes]
MVVVAAILAITRFSTSHIFGTLQRFQFKRRPPAPRFPSTTPAIETEKPPTPPHFHSRKISKMSNAEWYCTVLTI